MLQGHDRSAWRRMIQEGESEERLLGWALRGATPKLAAAMARWTGQAVASRATAKCGVCSLPHEEAAWATMTRWLESWQACPMRPSLLTQPRGRYCGAFEALETMRGSRVHSQPPLRVHGQPLSAAVAAEERMLAVVPPQGSRSTTAPGPLSCASDKANAKEQCREGREEVGAASGDALYPRSFQNCLARDAAGYTASPVGGYTASPICWGMGA